jgi:hypothetical protein
MAPERSVGPPTVRFAFPIHCDYEGGNPRLGRHGRHLWIAEGRIGHGELHLTHSIPLADVTSVEVAPRDGGGVGEQVLVAFGVSGPGRLAHAPAVVTDVTVRTTDGREASWVVEDRDARWVRERLAPALADAGIPFYGDPVPPGSRPPATYPAGPHAAGPVAPARIPPAR